MKESILKLGYALNKTQQKSVIGGGVPCNEWCYDPELQQFFPYENCSCGSTGGGNTGGSGGGGYEDDHPREPV